MDDYNLCTDDTIITVLAPWEFTGSWGDVASPTCTESQGPSSCVQSYPATVTPGLEGAGAEFTVTGSTNYNGSGTLTILSGQHEGWSQVTLTLTPTLTLTLTLTLTFPRRSSTAWSA